jgi:hypothetical protein
MPRITDLFSSLSRFSNNFLPTNDLYCLSYFYISPFIDLLSFAVEIFKLVVNHEGQEKWRDERDDEESTTKRQSQAAAAEATTFFFINDFISLMYNKKTSTVII